MHATVKYLLGALSKVTVKGSGIVDLKPLAKIVQYSDVELQLSDNPENGIVQTDDDLVSIITNGTYSNLNDVPDYEVGVTGFCKIDVEDIADLVDVELDSETHEIVSVTVPNIIIQLDSVYIISISA